MASAASHDDDNDTNSSYTEEEEDDDDEMAQTTTMQQNKGSTIATPSGGANSSSASGNNAAFVQLFKESSSPKPTSLASLPPTTLAAAARALHPAAAAARASVVPSHLNPFSAAVATGTTAVGSPHLSGAFSSLPFLQPTMAAAAVAAANHHPGLADLALMQQRMAMDEQVRLRYMAQMALMASRVGDARGNFFGLGMMQQQQQQQQSVALQQQQQQVAALQQQQQVTALQQKRRLLEAQQVVQHHHQQQQQQQKQQQEQAQPARKRRKLSSQMPHKSSLSIRQHTTSRSKQSSSFPLPPLPSHTSTASTPTRQFPVITSLQAHHDLWNRLIAVAAKSKVISSASAKVQHDFVSNQFAKALENPNRFQPKFANDDAVKHTKIDNDAKPRSKKPDRDDDSESDDDENEDYSDDDEAS